MPELVQNPKRIILLWKHRSKSLFNNIQQGVPEKNIRVEIDSAAGKIHDLTENKNINKF